MFGIGKKIFDFIIVLMMFCALICLFRPQVRASQPPEETPQTILPQPTTPPVTPTPHSPRPTPPVPLPFIQPSDKIWIVQGEVHPEQDHFTCRTPCRSAWQGDDFEIIQTTRGSEEWTSHQNEFAQCKSESELSAKKFLSGGSWSTAPASPDEMLCFLVIKQVHLRSER